jgi:hypothetical protein
MQEKKNAQQAAELHKANNAAKGDNLPGSSSVANCPYQSPRDSKDEEYNAPMFVGDTNKFDLQQIIKEMKARKKRPIPEANQNLKKRAKVAKDTYLNARETAAPVTKEYGEQDMRNYDEQIAKP